MGKPELKKDFEETSGVKDVSTVILRRRRTFEHRMLDFAENPVLSKLVGFGNKHGESPAHGVLQGTMLALRNFEDKYLLQREFYFDADAQEEDLKIIFLQTMDTLVKKWPLMAKEKYDWGKVCDAINREMQEIAGVFDLRGQMQKNVGEWFENYKINQTTEKLCREREDLNMQALRAHEELAYFAAVGGTKEVLENVRGRILQIDDRLRELPKDPKVKDAAFVRPTVVSQQTVALKKPAGNYEDGEKTIITRRPEVPGKGDWKKKIPLFGRFF